MTAPARHPGHPDKPGHPIEVCPVLSGFPSPAMSGFVRFCPACPVHMSGFLSETCSEGMALAHKRQEEFERRKHSMNGNDYSFTAAGASRARPPSPKESQKDDERA